MQNLQKFRKSMVALLAILFVISLSSIAVACPEYYESGCDGGWAYFGLRFDDANMAHGQIITLDCDASVSSVEFLYRVSGNPIHDMPSLVEGDEITAAVMDMDNNIIVTTSNTVPADIYTGWIEFVFPEGFIVPAGQYKVVTTTNVPRQCTIGFCYEGEDLYDGGQRTVSSNGIDGPWGVYENDYDLAFRLHLNEGSVPTQTRHWGSIKGMYR